MSDVQTGIRATVRIPSTMRTLTGGQTEVEVTGGTVRQVLDSLEDQHPGFAERLLDDEGELRRFVNLYVADEDVRHIQGLDTQLTYGSVVAIVPAVAGG